MTAFIHKLINTKQGVLVLPRIDTLDLVKLPEPDVRAESVTQLLPIGTALITDDGVFRYAKNGAAAVTIGKLLQQAVVASDHLKDLAVAAAAAVGATSVTITNGATTAITADMYKDGWLFVNDAVGEGAKYKIKSHPAAAVGASCVITLVDPIEVALTTLSQVGLRKNLYDGVVVNPTTQTGIPVGVVNHSSFTAAYYAWIKTKGIVALLTNGTVIVGRMVAPGATIPGSVDTYPITLVEGAPNTYAPGDNPCVGVVMSVGADTEYSLVKIDLDPSW